MPELPEAELARRRLDDALSGRTLDDVRVVDGAVVAEGSAEAFRAALLGNPVVGTARHGKHVFVLLGGGGVWWAHLGMSGRVVASPTHGGAALGRRARLVVGAGPHFIALDDPRRLARTQAGPRDAVEEISGRRRLGPDAWTLAQDPAALAQALGGRRGALKATLLDQTVLAGVGNIQAAEALYLAELSPFRPAGVLTPNEVARLAAGLDQTFRETLADLEATGGAYQSDPGTPNPFRVYGRAGDPCDRCGAAIARVRQGGRSTAYCPGCQGEAR